MVFKGFAPSGPYFAFVFLLVSPFAYFNTRRKRKLLDEKQSLESIKALNWKEFEELVAEAFRRQGFRVIEGDLGPDGGIDVTLIKDNQTTLVQCKQWRSKNVGVKVVREMFGVLAANAASRVLIICCGGFTRDAVAFSQGKPIQLIGGAELLEMVQGVQVRSKIIEEPTKLETHNHVQVITGICPKCGSQLVQRLAKKGPNAGNSFLGCSAFSKCRYTVNI
ncbi:MAG: restriction endonuclease [Paraglaciecola sp.]|uniref:restriction endonuclease n=1 Tax=Paraglaciecola sp. TaxID=1920173 RepID=UPI003298ABD7